MNARRGLMALALIAIAAPTWLAWAQTRAATPNRSAAAIATVGGRSIARDEFEKRSAQAVQEFAGRSQAPAEVRDLLRRQILETMIRTQLLVLEARRSGVVVSPLEAENELKKDPFFNPGGSYDASRLLAIKTTQKPQYDAAIRGISEQLAARRFSEQLEGRMRPDEAELRADARREVTRTSLDHLSLRRGDFNGSFPEPRESAILEYYRSHRAEFERPERARLSVAFANTPGLSDSMRRDPAALQAWTRRMRQTADSLVAVIRGGTDFEEACIPLGGARPGVVVQSDNFPGYWQGSPAQSASVFRARAGAVLDPIPGAEGFLLVRVEEVTPGHVAPLAEVSREIRGRLRADARLHHAEYEQRAIYAQLRDSLAGPAWKIRYAYADTGAIDLPEPSASDLDRYYRGHLADYSSFDASKGQIVARPLIDVRDDVRSRFLKERRLEVARTQADQLFRAWSAGKRDAGLESALRSRETIPVPLGATIDTGLAALAISDTMWAGGTPRSVGITPYGRGFALWQTGARIASHTPTFEQAREALEMSVRLEKEQEELAGARAMFDRDPARFSPGNVIHFTRAVIPVPDFMSVSLTAEEVARYHRANIDKYSAPELMRARHILISPLAQSPAADRAAREKATAILQRARAGEDFAKLAKENSDDEPTRDQGGDLGTFGRGTMLDEFDRAAFQLQGGEMSDLVKTSSGYHIILCITHEPPVIHPLSMIYSNVSSDAATAKAETLAVLRADSLVRTLRTVQQARAAAARLGLTIYANQHRRGDPVNITNVKPFFEAIEQLGSGEVMRKPFRVKGQGTWITWVDSITPPRSPKWEDVRQKVIDAYRQDAGQRALEAKRAELDSMFAAGWSLDSVGALWGGLDRLRDVVGGKGLPAMGGAEIVDSLVFGTARVPGLAVREGSPWLTLPNGIARLRVTSRDEASAEQLAGRVEKLRQEAIDRRMYAYFEDLKKRYPVRILDARLRELDAPRPPERAAKR